MNRKQRKARVTATEERQLKEHLSAAVEAIRTASSEITQARELLNENDFRFSWGLLKASSEVKQLRDRLYRTGYNYWLEK